VCENGDGGIRKLQQRPAKREREDYEGVNLNLEKPLNGIEGVQKMQLILS